MAEREFRLPGSPYGDLVNIIVAYGTRDEATRGGDVGKLDSVHQSSVSRNNAFLTEIGVLQGESKKLITRRGRSLAVALARKDRAEVRSNWRAIVAASEFLQNVVSAVKLREGMLYPTVQAYIAHAAGQPRNKPVMNGAGAIIEILKASGMLREEAGELVATFDERPEDVALEDGSPAQVSDTKEPVVTVGEAAGTPAGATSGTSPAVSIHVQVRPTFRTHKVAHAELFVTACIHPAVSKPQLADELCHKTYNKAPYLRATLGFHSVVTHESL